MTGSIWMPASVSEYAARRPRRVASRDSSPAATSCLRRLFLWASISLVEHWIGRASLLLLAVLALGLLLRWAYRRATRG
jgi:hypothetical protein